MSYKVFPSSLEINVSFPLHEALALTILWHRAGEDIDFSTPEGDYGLSCDLAALRIGECIAKATNNKEDLLHFGAVRALMDQKAI